MAEIENQDKAALAMAKQELEAARKNLADLQVKAQTAPGSDKPKAYQAVEDAQKNVLALEAKLNALAPQPMAGATAGAAPIAAGAAPIAAGAKPAAAVAPTFIAEHTLTADETLSHLALKYYGHATPAYWQVIYLANKELIGDNPNRVRPGMVIKVPKLPDGFKP